MKKLFGISTLLLMVLLSPVGRGESPMPNQADQSKEIQRKAAEAEARKNSDLAKLAEQRQKALEIYNERKKIIDEKTNNLVAVSARATLKDLDKNAYELVYVTPLITRESPKKDSDTSKVLPTSTTQVDDTTFFPKKAVDYVAYWETRGKGMGELKKAAQSEVDSVNNSPLTLPPDEVNRLLASTQKKITETANKFVAQNNADNPGNLFKKLTQIVPIDSANSKLDLLNPPKDVITQEAHRQSWDGSSEVKVTHQFTRDFEKAAAKAEEASKKIAESSKKIVDEGKSETEKLKQDLDKALADADGKDAGDKGGAPKGPAPKIADNKEKDQPKKLDPPKNPNMADNGDQNGNPKSGNGGGGKGGGGSGSGGGSSGGDSGKSAVSSNGEIGATPLQIPGTDTPMLIAATIGSLTGPLDMGKIAMINTPSFGLFPQNLPHPNQPAGDTLASKTSPSGKGNAPQSASVGAQFNAAVNPAAASSNNSLGARSGGGENTSENVFSGIGGPVPQYEEGRKLGMEGFLSASLAGSEEAADPKNPLNLQPEKKRKLAMIDIRKPKTTGKPQSILETHQGNLVSTACNEFKDVTVAVCDRLPRAHF